MSSYTAVSLIVKAQGANTLTLEDIIARWDRDVDYPTESFSVWAGDCLPESLPFLEQVGTITENGVSLPNMVSYDAFFLSFGSKWAADGMEEFARKLTDKYRGVEVTIESEWDDDEPSGVKTIWRSGKQIRQYEKGWVLS